MKNICNILFLQCFVILFGVNAYAQAGCTDPLANNTDAGASINDGSCTYAPANISPSNSTQIDAALNENSGLILWDNEIWTHTDGGGTTQLYNIDITDLSNFTAINIPGVSNVDWEEISQDEDYVYIGDFGNNGQGNRTNLKIYRVEKNSIIAGNPIVDEIEFSYADQIDFTPQGGNNTNFDCEAFIVTDTNIYLFTKEWINEETTVYSLPKTPGTYSAVNEGSFNVSGLITGATYVKDEQLVVLSGYSIALQPFLFLLYDYNSNNFFSGNKRKISVDLPFHQVEGITTNNGIDYFISNELISNFITIQPQIHSLNLSDYLSNFLSIEEPFKQLTFIAYPNPTRGSVNIQIAQEFLGQKVNISCFNQIGQQVFSRTISNFKNNIPLDLSRLASGLYLLKLDTAGNNKTIKIIVK